jgi:hypothetical protein
MLWNKWTYNFSQNVNYTQHIASEEIYIYTHIPKYHT